MSLNGSDSKFCVRRASPWVVYARKAPVVTDSTTAPDRAPQSEEQAERAKAEAEAKRARKLARSKP